MNSATRLFARIGIVGTLGTLGVVTACSATAIELTPAPDSTPSPAASVPADSGNNSAGGSPVPVIPVPPSTPDSVSTATGDVVLAATPDAPETPQPRATATAETPPTEAPGGNLPVSGVAQSNSMFGPITCDAGSGDIVLTHHIYEPEMFDTLVPMGRMWDSHVTPTDHLYLQLDEPRERGMVRTPAAGSIIQIERFPNDQSPFWDDSVKEPDIRVIVAHSCTLFSIYIHLGELTPEILAVTGDIAKGKRWSPGGGAEIRLDAGDPIARFGGSSIDYSLHDEAVTLPGFQVPDHYAGEPWKVHTVDPFDYLADDLAAGLQSKNERQVEPFGGQIDYDVPGTLAGNWFMDGTVDYGGGDGADRQRYWNGHMSIAYDHIDPSQIRISIGRDIGLTHDDCRVCGGVYAVNGNGPDPATVTAADGIVKYELTGRQHASADSRNRTVSDGNVLGTFLLRVLDDASIQTEFVKGALSGEVSDFSPGAIVYRR